MNESELPASDSDDDNDDRDDNSDDERLATHIDSNLSRWYRRLDEWQQAADVQREDVTDEDATDQ